MYTSGTTGNPKGVLLTHRQFLTGTYYFAMAVQASPDDRKLQAIPQFHAGGAIYQMAYMLVGATIVVLPLFDPETAVQLMKDEKVTVAGFVPAMLNGLCAHIGNIPAHVPNLRKIMYGGSSIPTSLLLRAMELFPVDFIQTYGQTEAAVIVTILDAISHRRAAKDDSLHLLRSCGRPILGYEVRLMTRDGPQTEAGELCVRSDALMSRYWKRPEATAATLVDGWLHTGDVATRDEDGLLYIVDRKVDMIVSGGENVYALEVENILSGHPDLAEVAVIGVPDPQWGELVLAVAVARDGRTATSDQVREFCRGRIGGFKIPKRIEYIDSLPRNASGKVLKHVLRKQFTGAKPY
jgi:acyl-CoA synthetase (AMP-forming)/AMP-acid ligase II